MTWTSLDTWIVVTGALAASSCAVIGSFLVLRRMSLMGDAISHAVLPGLAAAFLLSHSRASVTMFLGAAIVGVLTALLTQWIHSLGKVEESAAMGVVFTTLFAIGLIMIVRAADSVDLDPGCVLYGAIELTPLDQVAIAGVSVPRSVVVLSITLLVDVLFVGLFYKELRITSFDPALATTMGIHAGAMHYAIMTLVAVTTVAAFESVGSILVMAMLIVPAAAAHLLTDRYGLLLVLSAVLAATSAILGHLAAISIPAWFGFPDTTTGGMMALMAGLVFCAALLAAPRHGVISRIGRRLRLSLRIAREDVLGRLYRVEEAAALGATRPQDGVRGVLTPWLLSVSGRVRREKGVYTLTPTGRREAEETIRAHRLWESYLAKHFELPVDHLHDSAERMEHFINEGLGTAMAEELDDTERDPHGQVIPRPDATG